MSTQNSTLPKQPNHISNRNRLILALRREMMGPSCAGKPIDCKSEIICEDKESFYGPHLQAGSLNEIIKGDSPHTRYGIGVLYPTVSVQEMDEDPEESGNSEDKEESAKGIAKECLQQLDKSIERVISEGTQKDTDDFDISLANLAKPRCMGISFMAELPEGSSVEVTVKGGRYQTKEVWISGEDKARVWWLRTPLRFIAIFKGENILGKRGLIVPGRFQKSKDIDNLDIRIELLSRPDPIERSEKSRRRLITVYIVNRTKTDGSFPLDALCLFQARFSVRVSAPDHSPCVLPYPEASFKEPDEEDQSLLLLYRKTQTFATGHGCAADWDVREGETRATTVRAVAFPIFEAPSITPQIRRKDNTDVLVPMAPLSGLDGRNDGMDSLEEVVNLYGEWISEREREASSLENRHKTIANAHLKLCRRCYERMRDGLDFLRKNKKAAMAFKLANYAVLLQQIRSFRESRVMFWDNVQKRRYFKEAFQVPDPLNPSKDRGNWRPFQVAFLLFSLRSTAEGNASDPTNNTINDRETVELLWFPTGGGKTEAYLGLAAFALFMRRLNDKEDTGTHVLMRYTLRLLTAQQFQRAAGLICAMEYLRREHEDQLGSKEYSVGIWLGGETTPNTRADARKEYRELQEGRLDTEYHFVLLRCPWCGAQIGPLETDRDKKAGTVKGVRGKKTAKSMGGLVGVGQRDNTIVLHCPDASCIFHHHLPVYVIDEDIYEDPPSLIIGTVDKFAGLAWKPQARSIFGIGPDGQRIHSPPGLIIQDELHLITGPLGSIAGLYETVIEELCTDKRKTDPVRPKIVGSTATIRRYKEQIRGLYARPDCFLFPPPGLDAGDSFFSSYARADDGRLRRGKIYVGVHASSLGSVLTTNVRVYSSLLQTCEGFDNDSKDPWTTLMVFFNSLRELGSNLTLFQSDVPERILEIHRRGRFSRRHLYNIKELTGRISSSEIPKALQELEKRPGHDEYPVDVCLASSIIEVGIDVDRLSLMCIAGQPKTTSQYIQVTGRIGRRWLERPGLIVTIFSPSKPRDRSHFERFRSYHERLYAQVEPTSVTPFTPPALERALHAVMVSYVRQAGSEHEAQSPSPFPDLLIQHIASILEERVNFVDIQERDNLLIEIRERIAKWKAWNLHEWQASPETGPSLLRYPGTYYPEIWKIKSWVTPTSMRSVDEECMPEISQLYLKDNIEEIKGSG